MFCIHKKPNNIISVHIKKIICYNLKKHKGDIMENLKDLFILLLKDTSIIVASIVGVIIIYGFILGLLEDLSRKNLLRSLGYWGVIFTAPGVVIHELSHYIGCKIFRYNVKSVKLFRPIEGKRDGCLGYVSYKYDEDNVVQKIGLFFVGSAPIVGGTIAMLGLMWLLLPDTFSTIFDNIKTMINQNNIVDIKSFILLQYESFMNLVKILFTNENMHNILFWVFMYLGICISSHIGLSSADLKGSLSGLITLFIVTLLLGLILMLFGDALTKYISYLGIYNAILSSILTISVGLSIIHLILSYIIKFIVKLIK